MNKGLDRPHTKRMDVQDLRIAVVGLGYVGLPLLVAFGVNRPVVGFDVKPCR